MCAIEQVEGGPEDEAHGTGLRALRPCGENIVRPLLPSGAAVLAGDVQDLQVLENREVLGNAATSTPMAMAR